MRNSRFFKGAASYLRILASEPSDRLLREIPELIAAAHIQTADQLRTTKTIKGKISDTGKTKAEARKKALIAETFQICLNQKFQ